MKISYAILTHNEGNYIEKLIPFLLEYKREEDEIVIVDDYSDDQLTKYILEKYKSDIILDYRVFDGDASQKNYLNSKCTGDYILQLDADELISEWFIQALPTILEANQEIDLFILPRINTVTGLTDEWIKKWGWNVNEKGWVNFPDWQMRLYKNCEWVKWEGLLHSKVVGAKQYTLLPEDEEFCIIHLKELSRQVEQNNLYDQIERTGRRIYKVGKTGDRV
jgi:glycosyltransferase involved in cell wall biosynthesis